MSAIDTIKSRRSVRKYKSDPVPQELLDKIIEAGLYAPSGMGRQATIIISVTNKEVRDKLSKLNAKIMGTDSDPFTARRRCLLFLQKRTAPREYMTAALLCKILCSRRTS